MATWRILCVICAFSSVVAWISADEAIASGESGDVLPETCAEARKRSPNSKYADYVCEGIQMLSRGAYPAAVDSFRKADAEALHETPNFRNLAPLAFANCKYKNIAEGQKFLREFDLALQVYSGHLKCPNDSSAGGE